MANDAGGAREAQGALSEQVASAHQRLGIQYEIAHILAETSGLRDATQALFKTICGYASFVAASLWRVSGDAEFLQHVDFWTEDQPALTTLVAESLTLRIAPNTGLAGRAWASARPIWLPDIRLVTDLPLPTVKAGMRSGMAFPVSVQGEVRGVMVFWSVEPRAESSDTLDMFHAISNQIGQFMERDIQSAKVLRLSRMHAVLGGINKAIARAMERQQLFNDICRIAVDDGKFGSVWIGAFDGKSLEVTPVAWAGEDAAALVGSAMSTADTGVPRGHSVLGRAVRAKQLVYTNDLITETSPVGTRRLEALRCGYRSLLVMPLMENDRVTGTMSFFVKEADFFTPDEVALAHLSRKAASTDVGGREN